MKSPYPGAIAFSDVLSENAFIKPLWKGVKFAEEGAWLAHDAEAEARQALQRHFRF
jgi:hypothetical protein